MKKKYLRILLICLFLFCLSACGKSEKGTGEKSGKNKFIDRIAGTTEEETDYREKTTVMIYMTGSDLESGSAAATNDLKEMEESGVDLEQVTLLVYAGGAEQWHNDLATDKNTLLRLTKDGFQKEKDFDLLSMGDPENLSRFLSYAHENYPADRFHLLFWDHGNGPVMGYGKDMLFDGDSLTLSELRTALEKSPFGPENKLGIIGFDACLMASVELACVTGDYAELLISSQEVEPNYGWNYAFLKKCGRTTSDWLAKQIVDDYVSYNDTYNTENEFSNNDATLSVIDLSHAAELQAAVDQMFSSAVEDVSGDFNQLVKARVGTRGLGRASTGSEYDLVDLNHLAETMQKRYPEQTEKLQEALNKAVLINQSSILNCGGLSLYYPYYNKKYYSSVWKEEYERLNLFPNYKSYLDRYEDIWLGTNLKELYDGELIPKNGNTNQTYSLQLTAEQKDAMASCEYYILKREGGGLYAPFFASQKIQVQDNTLIAQFDGRVIYAENDFGMRFIPLMKIWNTYDEVTELSVKGYYETYDDPIWAIVNYRMLVNEDTGEITVKGIFKDNFMLSDDSDGLSSGKQDPIDPDEYNTFGFLHNSSRYLTRDEDGRIVDLWDWPSSEMLRETWSYVKDGLHFSYEPLFDDGSEYFIMFDIVDTQGTHICSELFPVQLAKTAEKTEPAVNEMKWNPQNGAQTIYDADGVTVELTYSIEKDGSTNLRAGVKNNNTYIVSVQLDEFRINNTFKVDHSYISIDSGETEYCELGSDTSVMTTCCYMGIKPEMLDFRLSIMNTGAKGCTIHRGYYRITDLEATNEIVYPVLGARADEQILYEEDGFRVKLKWVGGFDSVRNSDNYLNVAIALENDSGEKKNIKIGNAVVNGFFILTSREYENPYPYEVELFPGEKCYQRMKLEKDSIETYDIRSMFDDDTSPRSRMKGITSLSFYFMINGKELLIPVTLTETGLQEEDQIDGTVLCQNSVFQCILDGYGKSISEDNSFQNWYLSVPNLTDSTIRVCFFNAEENLMGEYLIGPHSCGYILRYASADTNDEFFPVYVKVIDDLDSGEFSESYYIELPFN